MEAINKNKEEIENILEDLEAIQGEWLEGLEDEIKSRLQERIKTSILWCESWSKQLEDDKGDYASYEQLETHLNWLKEQEKEQ